VIILLALLSGYLPLLKNANDPATEKDAQVAMKRLEDTLEAILVEENMKKKMLLKMLTSQDEIDNSGGTNK